MTLLIAGVDSKGMFLKSDTMITNPIRYGPHIGSSEHLDVFPGKLKIFLLGSDLCFGFSGAYDYAFEALRECVNDKISTIDNLLLCLTRLHISSIERNQENTNFIVLDKYFRKMYLLEDGKVEEFDSGYIWSGMSAGNEALKVKFITGDTDVEWIGASLGSVTSTEYMQNLQNNFDKIVSLGTLDGVGGFSFTIAESETGFRYTTVNTGGAIKRFYPTDGGKSSLMHKTLEEGGFAYATCSPKITPAPVIAVFLYEAGFGYIYNHVDDDSPVKMFASDIQEFANKAANFLGIYMESLTNEMRRTDDGGTEIFGQIVYGNPYHY